VYIRLAGRGLSQSYPHAHSLDPYDFRIGPLLRIGAFLGRRWNVGKRHTVDRASKGLLAMTTRQGCLFDRLVDEVGQHLRAQRAICGLVLGRRLVDHLKAVAVIIGRDDAEINASLAATTAPAHAENRRICRFNARGASDVGQSRQKSLKRVGLRAVYLVVCVIDTLVLDPQSGTRPLWPS